MSPRILDYIGIYLNYIHYIYRLYIFVHIGISCLKEVLEEHMFQHVQQFLRNTHQKPREMSHDQLIKIRLVHSKILEVRWCTWRIIPSQDSVQWPITMMIVSPHGVVGPLPKSLNGTVQWGIATSESLEYLDDPPCTHPTKFTHWTSRKLFFWKHDSRFKKSPLGRDVLRFLQDVITMENHPTKAESRPGETCFFFNINMVP